MNKIKTFPPEAPVIITLIRNENVELPVVIVIWARPLRVEMCDTERKEKNHPALHTDKYYFLTVECDCLLLAGGQTHIMKRAILNYTQLQPTTFMTLHFQVYWVRNSILYHGNSSFTRKTWTPFTNLFSKLLSASSQQIEFCWGWLWDEGETLGENGSLDVKIVFQTDCFYFFYICLRDCGFNLSLYLPSTALMTCPWARL